jgi:hypothetical protein
MGAIPKQDTQATMGSKEAKQSKHKNLPMRLLSRIHLTDGRHAGNGICDSARSVYIFRRTCIQTFQGPATRYLNLCIRLIETYGPFTHWGMLVSTEHPTQDTKAGQACTLRKPWTETGSSFELDVPALGQREPKVNVGSLERFFPTRKTTANKVIYLGTTNLSDEEISALGQIVLDYIQEVEGGYHGLYRNCQHFLMFLAEFVCPGVKLPKRVDETFGKICLRFKHKSKSTTERIMRAQKYCKDRLSWHA